MLSLILVALALLMRLVAAAADLRLPELALAALRGMPGGRMWGLGLAEPVLLLLLGLPVGLGLGVLSARLLARWWLVPGLPVPVSGVGLLAAAGVVVAGLLVSVAVVAAVLRRSLTGQLSGVVRPTCAARERGWWARCWSWRRPRRSSWPSWRASRARPGRHRPAAAGPAGRRRGLLATRAVASAARWWTRERPRSRWLPGYVARRAVARRREGTLVVLPWPPRSRWVSSPWVPTTPASPGAPASPTPSRQPTRCGCPRTRRPGPAT
ncbi:MAG: hypothetical protein R2731_06955 [Nocardioides sp.]